MHTQFYRLYPPPFLHHTSMDSVVKLQLYIFSAVTAKQDIVWSNTLAPTNRYEWLSIWQMLNPPPMYMRVRVCFPCPEKTCHGAVAACGGYTEG